MGTRNLTVIIKDNTIKLSQYCQWDGYFSCAGTKFLNFVNEKLIDRYHGVGRKLKSTIRLDDFKQVVDKLVSIDETYFKQVEETYKQYDDSNKLSIPFKVMFPQFHRDTGVEMLNILNRNSFGIENSQGFPVYLSNDLMCIEYINVLNLDTDELYMLTSHNFNGEKFDTCDIVKSKYEDKGFECFFKSSITGLKSIRTISKYVEGLGL